MNADNLRTCGNEHELACGVLERDAWNGACDTALHPVVKTCGCLVTGPLGGCLVPQACQVCENETRRRPSLDDFRNSWEDWALRNQRDSLANDEPINWVMRVGSHNSFNSVSDGHRPVPGDLAGNFIDAPNQFYSITDQLRTGARFLAIDAHLVESSARMCHGGQFSLGQTGINAQVCTNQQLANPMFPGMRYYANGIKEIRNWLRDNPNEILLFETENRIGGSCPDCLGTDTAPGLDPLRAYLGDMLFSLSDPGAPSKEDGRENDLWPSRRELLAQGARVIVFDQQLRDAKVTFWEPPIIADGGNFHGVFASNQHYYPDCKGIVHYDDGSVLEAGPTVAAKRQFSAVFEDRTLLAPVTGVGSLDVNDVRAAADCNYSIITMDFYSSTLPGGRDLNLPDFSRQAAAVWSWKFGDRGQNGDCAKLEFGSARWVSADCGEAHRFACAPPRSESGTDAKHWKMLESDWKVTLAAGPWTDGETMCEAEYPGYVFSVPVNGYQNRKLSAAGVAAGVSPGDLWLHYTDQQREGTWVIPRLATFNRPPIADAGEDHEVECGNTVTLDGSGSTDPDADPLTYTWTGPFGTLTGPQVTTTLPLGTHAITLAVSDGKGGTDTDVVEVTIADSTAPSITVSLSPARLWPPNHHLRTVVATVHVADACNAELVQVRLDSIVSNEPDGKSSHHDAHDRHDDPDHDCHRDTDQGHHRGHGDDCGCRDYKSHHHCEHDHDPHDHDRSPDIVGAELGTGDLEFKLRAERSARGHGRVYEVKYSATDSAGNTAQACQRVSVPRDPKHSTHVPEGC